MLSITALLRSNTMNASVFDHEHGDAVLEYGQIDQQGYGQSPGHQTVSKGTIVAIHTPAPKNSYW